MTEDNPKRESEPAGLPDWAAELVSQYECNATNQFILYGNVNDRMVLPLGEKAEIGSLSDFLQRVLMPRFDVVLSYDLGNGIMVKQGEKIFSQWPFYKENPQLPKAPRPAIEALTYYFRFCANLARLNNSRIQVGCFINAAHLVIPSLQGGFSYDLNAMAMLIKEWASDNLLIEHALATFLITENLNDLHPLIVNNPRTAQIKIPLPTPDDLKKAFKIIMPGYKTALSEYVENLETPSQQLAGATLSAIESLLKIKEHKKEKIVADDLSKLKKQLVEKDCNGLIEFIEATRTLDDIYGQEKIKTWLRQDIALWKKNDVKAMPMGYLLCGPVGTGKTFLVECLAGEAGVPVVKFKNFRDKWVGSTEGNLEKIFRLLQALGRCFVFIDEADQALGKRDSGSGDSNVSGRIYSMMAEEMSDTSNRGKIIWVLASSRPDLIEVDLKRPGRIDVKIPVFPTTTAEEGFKLLTALCRKKGVEIAQSEFKNLEKLIPTMLTAGAAETLAVKVYRLVQIESRTPLDALKDCLDDYQNPVPKEVLDFQIRLAIEEASDLEFVPRELRQRN